MLPLYRLTMQRQQDLLMPEERKEQYILILVAALAVPHKQLAQSDGQIPPHVVD